MVDLRGKQVKLLVVQVHGVVLVVGLLVIDVVAHVLNFALALLYGSVELHGLLRRVLQVLLEVGHLAGQLTLRGTILSILLLYLGKVLELDRFTLEHTSLHVLDEFLLLLTEELILQLHSVDLLLHGDDLRLTDCWVQSVLHLFLELVLSLPEQDLLFGIDDVNQDIALLLLQLSDLILELDRLVLHLFELLLEFHLNVEVVVGQLLLTLVVLVDHVIELVHLKDLVLLGDLELSDLLVVSLDVVVDANLLLLKDRLLGSQVVIVSGHLSLFLLALDERDLVRDPVLLHIGGFIVDLLHLLLDIVAMVLVGSLEVFAVAAALQLRALPVQAIDFECLLLNLEQTFLDVLLNSLHVLLFFFELTNKVFELLLKNFVLSRSVQVIQADT